MAKNNNKSRRAIRARRRRGSVPIAKSNGAVTFPSIPTTMGVSSEPCNLVTSPVPVHRDFGSDGIRLTGRVHWLDVNLTSGYDYPFSGSGDPQIYTNYCAGLGVSNIPGSRVQNIGRNYARYAFRSVKWTYVPYVNTSTTGAIAVGISDDGGFAYENMPTFGAILSMRSSAIAPIYSPFSVDYTYTGDQTWLVDYPTTSQIALRQCFQATMMARYSADASASTGIGCFVMDFVLDLYGSGTMTSYAAVNTSKLTADQIRGLSKAADQMRQDNKKDMPTTYFDTLYADVALSVKNQVAAGYVAPLRVDQVTASSETVSKAGPTTSLNSSTTSAPSTMEYELVPRRVVKP